MTFKLEERVEVLSDADYRPYAVIPKGEQGTVVWSDGYGNVDVKLDRYHPGLSQYANTIWLSPDDGVIVRKVCNHSHTFMVTRYALAAAVACFLLGALVLESAEAVVYPNVNIAAYVYGCFDDGDCGN